MKFQVVWGVTRWYEQTMEFNSREEAEEGWYENTDVLAASQIDYDLHDSHIITEVDE